jgi:hypothetical protein
MSDTKTCPFCKEEIKKDAIRCKHCGEDLPASQHKASTTIKKKEGIQVSPKVLVWILLGLASILFWYITIPGVAIWYVWKKPKLRAKLKEYLHNTSVVLRRHWKIVTPVAAILLLIIIVRSYSAPRAAAIKLGEKYEFTGNSVEISGKVTASCPCSLELSVNGKPVQIEGDAFKTAIDVPAGTDTGKVEIAAKVTGGMFNPKSLETKAESIFQRKNVPIEVTNTVLETGDGKYELNLRGLAGATVVVKGTDEKTVTLDGNGSGSILMGFNTAYNAQTTKYVLTASAEGYANGTKEIEVKNLKYDEKRVAADQEKERERLAAETEKKRVQEIIDNMQYFSGDGDVQIAVFKDILKSRTVGYRYVIDSKNDHFIRFGIAVKNVGSSEHHVNPNHVTIQDSSGMTYTPDTATYGLSNYLDAVNILPGAEAAGWLAFIVPKAEKELTVIYSSFDGIVTKKIYVP